MELSCEHGVSRLVPNDVSRGDRGYSSVVKQVRRLRPSWRLAGERTLMAKKSVKAIEPKYAAEKGSRGPEIRCFAYVTGPMRTAHEARNSTDPKDHLCEQRRCQ